jgi:hypothetical protein
MQFAFHGGRAQQMLETSSGAVVRLNEILAVIPAADIVA